jgi:hypothetical protein
MMQLGHYAQVKRACHELIRHDFDSLHKFDANRALEKLKPR